MAAGQFNINHAIKTPLCLSLLEHVGFNISKQAIAVQLTKRNADFTIKIIYYHHFGWQKTKV